MASPSTGKHYDLAPNPNGVTLHGGPPAYSRRILQTVGTFQHAGDAGVTLRLVSPDGDQGFPGTVTLDLTYTLTDNNDFKMEYKATTDKTDGGEPDQPHLLQSGGQWFGQCREPGDDRDGRPGDADRRLSGADRRVHQCGGHAVRFPRRPRRSASNLRSADPQMLIGRGYDHNYVLRKSKPGALELAARITDPVSGRTLELLTTEPGVQVYSSNNLNGGVGQCGGHHHARDGRAGAGDPAFSRQPQQAELPIHRAAAGRDLPFGNGDALHACR